MRPPDRIIGANYLSRWYIIPRNKWLNIYLHKFTGDDDDRALHDHPWWSVSFLLKGRLGEWTQNPYQKFGHYNYKRIDSAWPILRSATYAHRLVVLNGPAWTLFVTGPAIRQWGFLCERGWIHWRAFTDESGDRIGAGCGE